MTSTRSLGEIDAAERREHTDRLRAAVAARELELRQAMQRLQLQAQARVDIGRILAPHMPWLVAGAFVTGLWLGSGRLR